MSSDAFVPSIIQEALKQVENKKVKILEWSVAARVATDIVEKFKTEENCLTVSIGEPWAGCVPGVLMHADVLKIGDIVPVLRAIREAGYKMACDPEDYPEINRRTYNFEPIKVLVFFGGLTGSKEGAKCKFVQVGTEPKPVYKLECSDGEAASLAEAVA